MELGCAALGKEVPTSGLVGRNLMLCMFWDKSLSLLCLSFLTSKMGTGSVMRLVRYQETLLSPW